MERRFTIQTDQNANMNATSYEKRSAGKIIYMNYKGEQLFTEKKQDVIKGYQEEIIYISLV